MKVSIVIPIYQMDNGRELLERNLKSIYTQSFDDYEIVISDDSNGDEYQWLKTIDLPIKYFKNPTKAGMANNTNHALDQAEGELIKILFQDDFFYDSRCLENIVRQFNKPTWWLATACTHTFDGVTCFNDHQPYYSESENTLGSPSVITMRREVQERFDPYFRWVLDLDFYKKMFRKYGKPKIYDQVNVVIGIHLGQETNKLSEIIKKHEHNLLRLKYDQHTRS